MKKQKVMTPVAYSNVDWITPTSIVVKRFFMKMELFLKLHFDFWSHDMGLVSKVVNEE